MPKPSRSLFGLAVAAVASGATGCSPSRPSAPVPAVDPSSIARPRPTTRASGFAIAPALDRLFTGEDVWQRWTGPYGKLIVVDGEVATEYDAIVVGRTYENVLFPNPCRPNRTLALYAWRVRSDSVGIDIVQGSVVEPITDQAVGVRRGCTDSNKPRSGSMLSIYSMAGHVTFGEQAGEPTGTLTIRPSGKSIGDCSELRTPAIRIEDECLRQRFWVSAEIKTRASKDTAIVLRSLKIWSNAVLGFEMRHRCADGAKYFGCQTFTNDRLASLPRPSPIDRVYVPRFATARWRDQVVARTDLMVQLRPEMSDDEMIGVLDRLGFFPRQRLMKGSLIVSTPDPGADDNAFHFSLEKYRRTTDIVAAYPIDAANGFPIGLGSLGVVVVDTAGVPQPDLGVCAFLANPPGRRSCRGFLTPDRIESLPIFDLPVFVTCPPTQRDPPTVIDSTWVKFGPDRKANVRFVVPSSRSVRCADARK